MDDDAKKKRFSRILKYFKRYKWYLVGGAVAVMFTNSLMLVIPYLTKIIFDQLEKGAPSTVILKYVLISIGLAIISGFFRFMMRRTVIWMSRWIEYHLRNDLFNHLLKLSPSFYHNSRTGDIMARMTNDLEAVRMMIGPAVMHVGNTFVTITVGLAFMFYLSPRLTLYAIAPMILFPLAVNRFGNLIHQRFTKIQEHFSALTANVQENLSGIRVIKAYRQEKEEIKDFENMSSQYLGLNMNLAKLQSLFIPLLFFLASTLNIIVLYFGGTAVMNGEIPLGTMVAFFAYLNFLFWPMFALGWVISLYQRGTASLDRINKILNTEPIINNDAEKPRGEKMKGQIEFKNLTFAYNSTPVLSKINFTVKPGQTIGLVGPTGCGKTTLVSLLARLYPVNRGQILIDGQDINDWDLNELRGQIGFATQEPFLFSDTIEDNIRFSDVSQPPDEVRRSAATAVLDKDIEAFPDAYETMVGERGITLSGGQKQRTAIARAIMVNPAILILDDATSAVDTETDYIINRRIQRVLEHCTAIIISHRVSSVKNADVILYMEDGRIIENGSHDELVKRNGAYAELNRSQLLEEHLKSL